MNRDHLFTTALLTLGGPATVGACLGLSSGIQPMLTGALALPLVVVGTAAFTLPGLYISSAFTGIAPPAGEVFDATMLSLRRLGLLLVGLAPSLTFLVATSPGEAPRIVLAYTVLGASALVGLHSFARKVFGPEPTPRAVAISTVWGLLSLFLGWQLLDRAIEISIG